MTSEFEIAWKCRAQNCKGGESSETRDHAAAIRKGAEEHRKANHHAVVITQRTYLDAPRSLKIALECGCTARLWKDGTVRSVNDKCGKHGGIDKLIDEVERRTKA